MKLKYLIQYSLCLIFIQYSFGQKVDTIEYDIINLTGYEDRKPEYYKCDTTNTRKYRNQHINLCLSKIVDTPSNQNRNTIKIVHIYSEFDYNNRSDYRPDIRYNSVFNIKLDKNGNVKSVLPISHCIESISESDIIQALKEMRWRPALKNLNPVPSKFILEIIYANTLCHEEIWSKKKAELYRRFPEYSKELISVYINEDTIWDLEILGPMMKYDNEAKLYETLKIVELNCQKHIDSLNLVYNSLINDVSKFPCQKSYDITGKWDKAFYYYMEQELKKQLTHNIE